MDDKITFPYGKDVREGAKTRKKVRLMTFITINGRWGGTTMLENIRLAFRGIWSTVKMRSFFDHAGDYYRYRFHHFHRIYDSGNQR